MFSSSVSMAMMEFKTSHLRLNIYNFGDCAVYLIQTKLDSVGWACVAYLLDQPETRIAYAVHVY